jgi:hypothetical protein
MLGPVRWRRLAHRLRLTGVAVAGAVLGHMVAYVLAVPEPTARVALLGATGHAYWTAAIAAAVVLGLASVATTLLGRFRAWLVAARSQPGESVARTARHLAGLQVAIYLLQEVLERLEAGVPGHALLGGRVLLVGWPSRSSSPSDWRCCWRWPATPPGPPAERSTSRLTTANQPACPPPPTWWLAGRAGCWRPGWAAVPRPARPAARQPRRRP